jgi:hypothetical protein
MNSSGYPGRSYASRSRTFAILNLESTSSRDCEAFLKQRSGQSRRFNNVHTQRRGHIADPRQAGCAVLRRLVMLHLLFGNAELVGQTPLAPAARDPRRERKAPML